MGDDTRKSRKDPAQSETPGMSGNSMRENRETPSATGSSTPVRLEKATRSTASMHTGGESDEQVVPAKRSNKGERSLAESVEGSCSTKGNTEEAHTCRTQGREHVSQGLGGVREAARRNKKQKFTALLHHVNIDLLRNSYYSLKRNAAPGVDGTTWKQYGEGLEERIRDLHDRVHRGAYRAQPSRRTYIPRADGRQRPLGIAGAGRQDCSTSRGDGSQRDLRRGFSGFLLWVPAWAQTARCVGCAVGGAETEASEVGARSGRSWIFGSCSILPPGY